MPYKISELIVKQLDTASIIASAMILFIHTSLSILDLPKYTQLVQEFMGNGICRIAVPFFFLRSGYLFFLNVESFNTISFKLFKRFKTVLLPYFVWALLGLFFLYCISLVPVLRSYIIRVYPWVSFKSLVLHLLTDPINYQLWFLRDLFLLCLISPLLYYMIRYSSWIAVFCFLLVYAWVPFNFHIFYSTMSLFFFVLGGQIAVHKPQWLEYDFGRIQWGILFVFVLLTVYNAFAKAAMVAYYSQLNVLLPILGIVCLWNFAGVLAKREIPLLGYVAPYSFFIYLAHEPLLTFIKKIALSVIPRTELSLLSLYIMLPAVVLLIVLGMGILLRRAFPRIFSFAVGGR